MNEKIIHITSNDKKVTLYVRCYIPEKGKIHGVLQIVHGMTEYIDRYKDLAQFFTEKGYVVIGNDIINHGQSRYNQTFPIYFQKWSDPVEDILIVRNLIKEMYSGIPVYLLGFSLGSFLARSLKNTGLYEKKIFAGTGNQSIFVLKLMQLCISLGCRRKEQPSAFIKKLAFEHYNSYFKGEPENSWLLFNASERARYASDQKVNRDFTPQFFLEFLKGMEKLNKEEQMESIPTLFISGENDPVGGKGKDVEKVANKYKNKIGPSYVSFLQIPGYRHDILHDGCKESVYNTLYDFIRT